MKSLRIDMNGEVKELDIIRKDLLKEFHLHSRDLRPILLSNQIATILIRDDSIIMNLARVKLITAAEKVFLFQARNKEVSEEFVASLKKQMKSEEEKTAPFEFIVIDTALQHTVTVFDNKRSRLQNDIESTLKKINQHLTEEHLEKLLKLKQKMTTLETDAKEVQQELLELLEDEEDMENMYLSLRKNNKTTESTDDIESIIDNAHEQIEDIVNQIRETNHNIESTLEITTLKMNNLRNSIIRTDLLISLGTGVLTFGAVIVGLFGANLLNQFEDHPLAFPLLTGFVVMSSIVLFLVVYFYFKKKKIL